MKKILCLLLSIVLLFGVPAFAEEASEPGFDLSTIAEDFVYVFRLDDPLASVCGLERDADEKCYPASTTKILTCIIALETGDLSAEVRVTDAADSDRVSGSVVGIQKKEEYSLEELLYGMMLPSGNDCANAVAIHLGGSIAGFAEIMNEKAAAIGMEHSHFVTPSGLHSDEHYTTARDMAILTAYALQNEQFRKIISTKEFTMKSSEGRRITVRTSNRFLRNYTATTYKPESVLYAEAIGVKTGDTQQAGKCLIAAAQRGDTVYVAILLHGPQPPSTVKKDKEKDKYATQRYKDARALFEYAFEHDEKVLTADALVGRGLQVEWTVESPAGQPELLSATLRIDWNAAEPFAAPYCAFPKEPDSETDPNEWLSIEWTGAPYAPGERMGTALVTIDGVVYFSAPVYCEAVATPTPEPTPTPTPAPTPTHIATPYSTPEIEVQSVASPTPSPETGFHLFDWLSCAPRG